MHKLRRTSFARQFGRTPQGNIYWLWPLMPLENMKWTQLSVFPQLHSYLPANTIAFIHSSGYLDLDGFSLKSKPNITTTRKASGTGPNGLKERRQTYWKCLTALTVAHRRHLPEWEGNISGIAALETTEAFAASVVISQPQNVRVCWDLELTVHWLVTIYI